MSSELYMDEILELKRELARVEAERDALLEAFDEDARTIAAVQELVRTLRTRIQ